MFKEAGGMRHLRLLERTTRLAALISPFTTESAVPRPFCPCTLHLD